MTNPVAREITVSAKFGGVEEYRPAKREVIVYCPGCCQRHHLTVEVYDGYTGRNDGSPEPVWQWDGNLDSPTFSPSLLCYSTVHLCEGEHAPVTVCDKDFGECEHRGHGYVWINEVGEQRFFKVYEEVPEGWERHTFGGGIGEHPRDPAWGNCHSFLRDGVWEFLGDCAHGLANQRVPLEPLPDWLMPQDETNL